MTMMNIRLIMLALGAALLSGCGMMREYTIQTTPAQAMVLQQRQGLNPQIFPPLRLGTTPLKKQLFYSDENDARQHRLTIMKRGYEAEPLVIDKSSPPKVEVALRRIPEVNERVFDPATLPDLRLHLLPITVQVNRVSDLAGKEKTPDSEATQAASETVTNQLLRLRTRLTKLELSESASLQWQAMNPQLRETVNGIDAALLPYQPRPLLIESGRVGFAPLRTTLKSESPGGAGPFFLYLSGVCNVDTAERTAKKAAADVAGFLLQGITGSMSAARVPMATPYFHDSRLATPSGETQLQMAVIDAASSEVLHVDRLVIADCTQPEAFESGLVEVAKRLGTRGEAMK